MTPALALADEYSINGEVHSMSKVIIVIAALIFAAISNNRIEVRPVNQPQTVRVAAHLSGFHNAAVQMAALENE